ncbi:DUF2726 domain-containing protein [Ottowia thiooxydans]|uniref:DUF2726 domain-containing protein n=1 Tax=Ottowia thiooxydans TaxID=219182 RepID=UPI000404BD8B|nr:DUF2726 domain-containing protein [Ottowia thiooxydans]
MTLAILAIFFIALLVIVLKLTKQGKVPEEPVQELLEPTSEKPVAKALLTDREQAMFNRLSEALPSLIVLTQVSFGAILHANLQGTRNTFSRKIADFAICSKAFEVLAVIELDDATHRSKKAEDENRDQMLRSAGYEVLRYPNVPDREQVQKDFVALLTKRRNMTAAAS